MNPEAIRIAKIKKALIEKKRKAEEAEKASKLREEQKVIKTEIAEKARGLRPNEYFIYAAGTDDGVKISLEALQQSDLLTSMIDVTGMYGGKEIPLAGYLFEQIKIVCDTLNSWLENKKRVEESIKGLSDLNDLIKRANLFDVFGVSFDIMKVIFDRIDQIIIHNGMSSDSLEGLNQNVQKLLMTDRAVEHLKKYMMSKRDAEKTPNDIIGKEAKNISSVAFSPDGKKIVAGDSLIVAGASFGKLMLWDDIHNLKNPIVIENVHNINVLAFSRDGKKIAVGCLDDLIVFDANNLKNFKSIGNIGGDVKSVAFSPDGNRIVTGSLQRCVLWDIGSSAYKFIGEDDISNIGAVAFSPDGNKIAVGSHNKLMLWDISNLNNITSKLIGTAEGNIEAIAFNSDGSEIVTGGIGSIMLWDVQKNTFR
ncbi:MAG TPA: hypothetical protein VL201_02100, partial [Patescibacteria group bacterium]|nr:hypothetical protein [Patescibacteria group bacterium]